MKNSNVVCFALAALMSGAAAGPAVAQGGLNVAYVDVNNSALSNAGCYTIAGTGAPFFNFAMLFAANINGADPDNPGIFFNPNVARTLDQTDQVKELQRKGIKVMLSLLNNHQNSGWSCVSRPDAAVKFADRIAEMTQKYGLDGIDIDDEYHKCRPNDTSMIMIAEALKRHAKFKGKILSKALFDDQQYFGASHNDRKLAELLDYGWEMTYGAPSVEKRLAPYLGAGMSRRNLAIGVWEARGVALGKALARDARQQGFAGLMVFAVKKDSQPFLTEIAKAAYNQEVKVDAGCLR